jgi:predicted RNA-binding Zn-ribbon protein involved in translation (DUF1610 family)
MNQKKPEPMLSAPQRKVCPVCGQVSYSAAGVHPQCAETQADQKRMQKAKAKKTEKPVVLDATPSAWRKPCPKCGTQVHVRKAQCECGHKFVVQKTKSGVGNDE